MTAATAGRLIRIHASTKLRDITPGISLWTAPNAVIRYRNDISKVLLWQAVGGFHENAGWRTSFCRFFGAWRSRRRDESMISIAVSILILMQTYAAPRTPDGHTDLQGIWQVRNTANWDLLDHTGGYKIPGGLGVVEGGEIPYKPDALAQKKKNFENRLAADPVEKCYLAGFPRTIYLPYPFQILQTPDAVIILS